MSSKQTDPEQILQQFYKTITTLVNRCVVDARYVNSDQNIDYLAKKETILEQGDPIVSELVYSIKQILKDKVEPSSTDSDVWTHVNNYLVGRYSLEFIKAKCATIPFNNQFQLWVLLELSQKSLDNVFEHIAATEFISQYKLDSCIRDKFLRIIEYCKILQKEKFKISGRFPQNFDKYVSEQDFKDASFCIPGKGNQNRLQNGNANQQAVNTPKQQLTTQETVQHHTSNFVNYNVVPSITDITPKLLDDSNKNMNGSAKLNQLPSMKIEMNGVSQITKVVEESEEERTGRNMSATNLIDLKYIMNMNNTNGRTSNAILQPYGMTRPTMGYSDSSANLLLFNTPNPDDGNTKKGLPSEILFKDKFANITDKFPDKYQYAYTLKDQQHQCNDCKSSISKGLYIIGNNAYFCHYTGRWYCYNCIAPNKKPIPWKALESFDLTSYKVSKKAEKEIEYLYNKPIIQFEYDSKVVQNNQVLYDFMILKRQIYLLYNFLCHPKDLERALSEYTNLLIKPNIFSLKNFYDINNGALIGQIENTYKLFLVHIQDCERCLRKGIDCALCQTGAKVYLFDIKNTMLCDKCNTLYHRDCLLEKYCETCKHDN